VRHRLVASYCMDPSALTFLPRRPGPTPGSQRLDLERESFVADAVKHWKASPEPLPVERAFEEVGVAQADHTPIDLIVVDDINRLPIGRRWITVIFDVASRAVLGFHATLEAPSATSVAMALSMACLPKLRRLKEFQLDLDWPMYGIPEVLHLDNASEYHHAARSASAANLEGLRRTLIHKRIALRARNAPSATIGKM
jgi:transposase InsO family protein